MSLRSDAVLAAASNEHRSTKTAANEDARPILNAYIITIPTFAKGAETGRKFRARQADSLEAA